MPSLGSEPLAHFGDSRAISLSINYLIRQGCPYRVPTAMGELEHFNEAQPRHRAYSDDTLETQACLYVFSYRRV